MGDENVPPGRLSATGSLHKINKPMMERRRRQRINDCLNQLKSILETLTHKQTATQTFSRLINSVVDNGLLHSAHRTRSNQTRVRYTNNSYMSKLEKADILEMTVHCVKNLRQRQSSGESLAVFNAAQYVEGFDACTREVTDCLQSQNVTMSPELYAGLLSRLATCRRRLLVTRSRDHQHTMVLPPTECHRLCSDLTDENASCVQTNKIARQTLTAADEENRSPLSCIDNLPPLALLAAEFSTKVKQHTDVRTREHSIEQTARLSENKVNISDVNRSSRIESCTSHDVEEEADYNDVLSLATDEDVTSVMWRPW